MASQEFPAFEQWLENRPQGSGSGKRVIKIREVTGPSQPKDWAYVAHDALGLLVNDVDAAAPPATLHFIPWHTIVEIR